MSVAALQDHICLLTLYPGLPILTAKGGKKANENSWQENTVLIT